ncbi:MAG: DUF4428 domain-containing protein, partial [Clostridia bacterium]|nr:DUF4428 domain-containing protein [Clostridia bacterium]
MFEKKFCDNCGQKIGFLGNNKMADGNLCDTCRNKLSPFFRGINNTTLAQVQQQLAYREQNRQQLNYFNPTRVLGSKTKVYIDDNQRKFVVSRMSDYKKDNPDIIDISQVSNVHTECKEHKTELYTKNAEGHSVSYTPKRYKYKYEISLTIFVNSPYFSEIKFELTDPRPESNTSMEYQNYQTTANQITAALSGAGMNQGFGMNTNNGIGQMNNNYNNGGMNQMNNGFNNNNGMGQNGMNTLNNGMCQNGMNTLNNGMGQNGMNTLNN